MESVICEQCGASNLPEARFCEACGHELGTPAEQELPVQTVEGESGTGSVGASPGSLRDEIPFLTGAVEQAKARIEDWRLKNTRKKTEAERERRVEEERRREEQQSRSPVNRFISIVLGLVALAAFLALLLRYPRQSPEVVMGLMQDLMDRLTELGWDDGSDL